MQSTDSVTGWPVQLKADNREMWLADKELAPLFPVTLTAQFYRLFDLSDGGLRVMAILKMEGYSNREAALYQHCT